MKSTKKTKSYYLDPEVSDWLESKGIEQKRSASYWLNDHLKGEMDKEAEGKNAN